MPADDPVQTVACANGGSDSRSWPGEALSGLEEGRMSSPPRRTACFSRASASGARRRRKRVLRWSCRRRERSPSTRARNIYEYPLPKFPTEHAARRPQKEERACDPAPPRTAPRGAVARRDHQTSALLEGKTRRGAAFSNGWTDFRGFFPFSSSAAPRSWGNAFVI